MSTLITQPENINLSENSRATRVIIGIILIAITMTTQGTIGTLAILPLLAIYPIFTGLTGWDPLKQVCHKQSFVNCMREFSRSARTALLVLGVAMIAPVYLVSGAPGWLIVLPLVALYPIFLAMLGEEPVTALLNIGVEHKTSSSSADNRAKLVSENDKKSSNNSDLNHHDLAA